MNTGFSSDQTLNLNIPADFLGKVMASELPADAVIILLAFYEVLGNQETPAQAVQESLLRATLQTEGFPPDPDRIVTAIETVVEKGFLMRWETPGIEDCILIPSTPYGMTIVVGLQEGRIKADQIPLAGQVPIPERPNIYKLYEANIGPLTPIIAAMLDEDARTYPLEWIQDALSEAAEHNVRNWKYVRAILKMWREKGRGGKNETNRSDLEYFRELSKKSPKRRPK